MNYNLSHVSVTVISWQVDIELTTYSGFFINKYNYGKIWKENIKFELLNSLFRHEGSCRRTLHK